MGKITRHSPDSSFLVEKCECIMKRKILHIYDKLPDLHKDRSEEHTSELQSH